MTTETGQDDGNRSAPDVLMRRPPFHPLELHTMRELVRPEREHRLQVALDNLTLLVLLDSLQDGLVDGLLVGLALFRRNVLLDLLGKDIPFGGPGVLLLGHTTEVRVVDVFRHLEVLQVDPGLGGNDVVLGDTTHRAAVQGERTSDQQQSRLEGLQQDDTLSLMATGQQDQNLTLLQGLTDVPLVVTEALLTGTLADNRLGRQIALVLLQEHRALTSVLGTADLLHNSNGDLRLLGTLHPLDILQGEQFLLHLLLALQITTHSIRQGLALGSGGFFHCFFALWGRGGLFLGRGS